MEVDLNLNRYGRDTVIEIDLDAFEHNLGLFRSHLLSNTQMMIAIKANAYGHGSISMARAAIRAGVTYLSVAFVDEGIELRNAGIRTPILILGYTPPYAIEDALFHDLTLTVFSFDQIESIHSVAKRRNVPALVHVKVDTGMGRIGIQPDEVVVYLEHMRLLPYIRIEGLYSHFSTADHQEEEYFEYQKGKFSDIVHKTKDRGYSIPFIHIANSAGAMKMSCGTYNMVRLGIAAYGYYPSVEMDFPAGILKPVLSFKSKITQVKKPASGTGISYGTTYKVTGNEWIATVPVGYADGFSRSFSNRGHVLVAGHRVPVVGRVCMDQLMIDVTKVMPAQVGDDVVIYGQQGSQQIMVEEIARELGTISYEVTCALSHRIPRVYLRKGRPVEVVNRLRA